MATKKPKTLEGNADVLQKTLDATVVALRKSDDDRAALQERCRRYEEELVTVKRELTKDLTTMSGQLNAAIKERDAFKQALADSKIATVLKTADAGEVEFRAALDRSLASEQALVQRISSLENFIRKSVQHGLNFTEAGEILKSGA